MSIDEFNYLREAIFQIRWKSSVQGNIDPYYRLLIGKFHETISNQFPINELGSAAMLPEDFSRGVIQYKFKNKDNWPLIQLGPGILTVNDTSEYSWSSFKPLCLQAVKNLKTCYQKITEKEDYIDISSASLMYINAFPYKFSEGKILSFIKEKMKINIELPDNLFSNQIDKDPFGIQNTFAFKSQKPVGEIKLTVATAEIDNKDEAIILQLEFSTNEYIENFEKWLEETHSVLREWFQTITRR